MSVFIYQPDAFDLICSIEGDEFRNGRHDDAWSFPAFKKAWLEAEDYLLHNPDDRTEAHAGTPIRVEGDVAIYGNAGYNRYFVLGSGEIVFSRHHASRPVKVEEAEAQGFRIWPLR